MHSPSPEVDRARALLAPAARVAVLTGAGISAESGVPTFRGAGGLWRGRRAADLATPEAFRRDPELVWEFYHWRRQMLAAVTPNRAHYSLVELEAQVAEFTLATQNVDDLHRQAGSIRILELHGNIWRLRCAGCGQRQLDRNTEDAALRRCPECGGLLRPDVVWFGEPLDPQIWSRALAACQNCQVLLVVGTSAMVQPAASLALVAREAGAKIIEVNLEATPLSSLADISLRGKAAELVPALVAGKND